MWVGGGKQDKFRRLLVGTVQMAEYGELEKVKQLNKGKGGGKEDKYGELVEV